MYSTREETIQIDWPAYPHYHAPEDFAPIILDGKHLYYVNSFESAASAMETGAVAAENVARLIISRLPLGLRASPLLSSEKAPMVPLNLISSHSPAK
jgi:prenylcysteine oxidase/farnesylcysteine lyase